MSDKDHFLKLLNEKFVDLQKIAIKNKYKVFIPLKKFITDTMLTENFYSNHIFYVSKYDDSMYINLNGKVLKYEHPKFTSVLGWKKKIEFQIKDQFNTSYDLSCIAIDNVCDETGFNESGGISTLSKGTDIIKKCKDTDEYIKHYSNIEKLNPDYAEAVSKLNHFVDLMMNNYIFMKGHEDFYSFTFLNEARNITEAFKVALKAKDDPVILTTVSELVDTLIFAQMYDFLFGSLVTFHKEEQELFIAKTKELPNKFDLTNGVDEAYKDCKFEKAGELLKQISKYRSIFEKIKLITDINTAIGQEAKEAYDKMYSGKKQYNPQGDLLLTFWTFLVSHYEVKNIVAEAAFLQLFNVCSLNNFGEASYLSTTFITAVNGVFGNNKNDSKYSLTQNIQSCTIKTNPISTEVKRAMPERSQSVSMGRTVNI